MTCNRCGSNKTETRTYSNKNLGSKSNPMVGKLQGYRTFTLCSNCGLPLDTQKLDKNKQPLQDTEL